MFINIFEVTQIDELQELIRLNPELVFEEAEEVE
jgi:hypothetical protein